jgi:hypothetical protein
VIIGNSPVIAAADLIGLDGPSRVPAMESAPLGRNRHPKLSQPLC